MISVKKTGAALGAEIEGVDLSQPLADDVFGRIRDAFLDNSVIVVRGQRLTPNALIAFSRRFGALEPYESTVAQFLMPEHPEIIMISNIVEDGRPLGIKDAGQYWHTDRSYVPNPSWASVLYAIEVPVGIDGVVRGDTQFASTIAACASLPATLRRRLSALRACHRYVYRYTKPTTPLPEVEHPIIARHPYNGKPSLYVNAGFTHGIAGMDEHEGRALLQELYDHVAKPEFVYRHKWRKGDVIMWDNCATQHNAVGDYEAPLRRLMWRTTISGVGMQPSE